MKMNRISAALIALLMVLAMLPAASLAADSASTINMVPELNEEGTKLVLSFVLETNAQPLSGVLDLYYDADCLLNPAEDSDALPGQSSSLVANTETEGNVLIGFASSTPMQSGEIFYITFDLNKEACTPGTEIVFSVDIENCELVDYDTTTLLDLNVDDVRFTFPSDSKYEMGDVNRNGGIDAGDATLILRATVGAIELEDEQMALGDMNNNGGLDAGDATQVLRAVVAQA